MPWPRTRTLPQRQALCWLTATNERVHSLIRENLHRSPMYSGQITGIGPRYCPSVEDKVVKNALVTEKTPGLEDLWPQAVTGDHGLSLIEPAPFGVISNFTPCTTSMPG